MFLGSALFLKRGIKSGNVLAVPKKMRTFAARNKEKRPATEQMTL